MDDFELPEEADEYRGKAKESSRESIDLIEKVRKVRETKEDEIKTIEIKGNLKDVVKKEKKKAENRDIEIKTKNIAETEIRGGNLLNELFSNIVSNSIEHSNGGEIRISTEETENELIVKIEDDGRGIPDEDKEKVFERGFRGDESSGSGLGMYLVKEIAENYGGTIKVRDSELGGTRVDVHLEKA